MKVKLLFYIIVLISIVSCKKDDEIFNTIYNKWTYVSGGERYEEDFYFLKYIIIQPDHTVSFLYEYNYGIRGCYEYLSQITSDQISLFGRCLFNFTIEGNTLILSNPFEEIIFENNGNEPSRQEWVATVSRVQSMDAPNDARSDITFDGGFLWYGGFSTYNVPACLYKIDLSTLSVVQDLTVTTWPIGLEWADGYLWTSSNGYSYIYKVDPVTGLSLFNSVSMDGWISGIAFDGQYFWCGSNDKIYKYDPDLNTIVQTFQVEHNLDGLAYIDDYLYVCINGVLNKCIPEPLQSVGAFDIKMGHIYGIAYDGNDFWISVGLTNEPQYYKISKIIF